MEQNHGSSRESREVHTAMGLDQKGNNNESQALRAVVCQQKGKSKWSEPIPLLVVHFKQASKQAIFKAFW